MKVKRGYRTYAPGEWFRVPTRGHLLSCCDCGLVHLFKSRIKDGNRVEVAAYRMPPNTGGKRKAMRKR